MTTGEEVLELRRARWRRARSPLLLADATSSDFARGGLAGHVAELSVRFIVLPADPERAVVLFDEDFWEWWRAERDNPFPGQRTQWGYSRSPTGEAAAIHDQVRNQAWAWGTYLAVHRSGALEFGLGRSGVYEWRDQRVLRLIEVVGRVWCAVDLYGDVVDRFGLQGPWESSLALRETKDAQLGNVAQGWAEPGEGAGDLLPCPESNLLFTREAEEWPRGDAARALAFEFGSAVDESWGATQPRFIARRGPKEGEFDYQMFRGAIG
jgi:hypothetical protein